MIKLITVSDDRSMRKGGQYEATQNRIQELLAGWIDMHHYRLEEFINCDPLMVNTDAAKNGRVYKPWCIADALSKLDYGDYLIYNDCSPELWELQEGFQLGWFSLDVIKGLTDQANGILVGFVKWDTDYIPWGELGSHTHRHFSPNNLVSPESIFYDSFLCASGMICIRKSDATMRIVDEWLACNRMPQYSCMNVDETEDSYFTGVPGNKSGHRHDQSILSLLLNEQNWQYCAIQYNEMNPYNFLNYCRVGVNYEFINSNP